MSTPFELPSEITIYSVMETRDALLAWVTEQLAQSSKLLEVSATQVQVVDGAGLQLLLALSNMGQPWRLRNPSEALQNACRTLGLDTWISTAAADA